MGVRKYMSMNLRVYYMQCLYKTDRGEKNSLIF